ncbi:bacteriorhodopsin [Nostoc sp. MS1]|uniref:bacteriorhodopsin n=1 Tax=Nostoc sp. MS1 TaxID=2764711 RepID=UPI001CC7A4AD|nr:bacteriorhodopsin [Nostoc sp. MS1]BCL39557.1 hypothetical protein NSMS1_60040 [Nostoc sp. MS1]
MIQFWLWVAFIGMTIGSVFFGLKADAMLRREGMEFPLESCFITLWAATMYLTMILGETVLRDFNGITINIEATQTKPAKAGSLTLI